MKEGGGGGEKDSLKRYIFSQLAGVQDLFYHLENLFSASFAMQDSFPLHFNFCFFLRINGGKKEKKKFGTYL